MKRYQQGLVVMGMMVWLSGCQNGAGISSEHETQNQSAELVISSEYQDDAAGTTEMQTAAPVQSESQPMLLKPSEEIPETAVAREIMYHYYNGIKTYNKILIDNRPEVDGINCVQISGLRDEQVQQKINDRLEQAVIELATRELPPYRGIKRKTAGISPDDLKQIVYMFVQYNESNLFSVRLERRISYEYVFGTDDMEGLTFDLNTGEELVLSDLFADGYDYQAAIVEYIRDGVAEGWLSNVGGEYFYSYSDLFTLLKPFDTVKKTQKFYLSEQDTISLILDYDTPEFDVEGHVQILRIEAKRLADKGNSMIFFKKYETGDERLYKTEDENFRRRKTLEQTGNIQEEYWSSYNPQMMERAAEEVEDDEDEAGDGDGDGEPKNISFHIEVVTNVENPELAMRMSEMAEQSEERFAAFFADNEFAYEWFSGVYYRLRMRKWGNYLNVNETYYFEGTKEFTKYYNKVYNSQTGAQMSLWDCFAHGSDNQEMIKALFLEKYEDLSEEELLIYFEDPQFEIGWDVLYLRLDDELYGKNLELYFHTIGYEELTLFDEVEWKK